MISRIFFFLLISTQVFGQNNKKLDLLHPPSTPAVERIKSHEKRTALVENSLVKNVPFKNVGPTVMGGRISEIAVNPNNPNEFYAAYASGGLWHTKNNGQSFEPLFQNEIVMTLGALAVDWKNNVIWVGTGEVNSSRSSYSGVGMFKSTDSGKTWTHSGLPESHHIGRIVMHPSDPNTVWVAVLGHLYSANRQRGVYKTTDGGATWKQTLFVTPDAGAVDLQIDPNNPNNLFAAIWERTRRAWNFTEAGENSGIYTTTDGGENWTLSTGISSGFPKNEGVGRIGIDVSNDNGKTVIYACLDNQNRRAEKEKKEDKLDKKDFQKISVSAFANLDDDKLESFLEDNRFPEKYSAKAVKEKVAKGEIKPNALFEYLNNTNSLLFDTEVVGMQVYRSDDLGKTWNKTHEGFLDDVIYSYGYYFGFMRVHPTNPDEIYIAGVPVLMSADGGKNWENINGKNVHVDHHELWINPDLDGHLILGNDGGLNITYDHGKNWNTIIGPPVGQFYYIAADEAKPYNIYGGLQDNGVWKGPSTYTNSKRWQYQGRYPYETIMGGDGMQIAIDTRDNSTVYTGYQFGNYSRINTKTKKRSRVTPMHNLGESPLRWNWQTPIHLSKHNQDIFYMGSNKLHRSFDQGETWKAISEDLTLGGKKGDVPFGTLSTIHESDMQFGLIYTGSDDGKVHVTKDGGSDWEDISVGLPENLWIARIQASSHEKSRVYVTLNGYRWDNFRALVYVSENYGKDWKKIGTDLPLEPVNVIKEDPENADLIYVGTDHGLYVSLNRGANFMAMNGGLPNAPVHDVVVQKREKDLLVGTHGRSIFKADISPVQALKSAVLEEELYVFEIPNKRYSGRWGNGSRWFKSDPPEASIPFYSNKNRSVEVLVKAGDIILKKIKIEAEKGINFATFDLTFDESKKSKYESWLKENAKDEKEIKLKKGRLDEKWYVRKGSYEIEVKAGTKKSMNTLKIE